MVNQIRDAYFAGIIDGEGFIGFSSNGKIKRPVVQVRMTCEKTINAIREHFECGNISAMPPEKSHYKPSWMWRATNISSVIVLKRVAPYLITKLDAANFVLNSPATKRGSRLFVG